MTYTATDRLAALERGRQLSHTPETQEKLSAAMRLEQRVKIAEEKAAKLRAQFDRKQEKERRAEERRATSNRSAHGIAGCHARITALESRLASLEGALGFTHPPKNGIA